MCKYCGKNVGYKLASTWSTLGTYYVSVCKNCGYPTLSEVALTYQYYAQVAFFSASGPRVILHVTEQELRNVLKEKTTVHGSVLRGLCSTKVYMDERWSNV